MSIERKRLIRALIPPAAVALLRFGGGVVLSWFDMGWRCGPRYIMDFILIILLIVAMYHCTKVLDQLASVHPSKSVAYHLGAIVLMLTMFILPCAAFMYSVVGSWHDSVETKNGYTIVRESNGHGSHGEIRCFLSINGLVHGTALEYDWRTSTVTLPDGRAVSMY